VTTKSAHKAASDRSHIVGYATRWLKPHAHPKTGDIEVFLAGCFARSLTGHKAIRFLCGHREANLVATSADDLELATDDEGLAFRLRIPHTEMGSEVRNLVRYGQADQMSVGYTVEVDHWKTIDGTRVRIIADASLNEISLVECGAVPGTFAAFDDGQHKAFSSNLKMRFASYKVQRSLFALARAMA